ncbi:MAG: hypothetical protein DRP09_15050 [Candidatus Thorarchaeota archaeon]|nr:MAG: hypothetical protein DRP09_15050 [Candidatus Thorarchaeota archaeon]
MDLQNIWSDGYLSPDEAKRVEFYKNKLNPVIRVWEKTHNLYIKSIIVWRDSGKGKEKVEELQNELSELTSQVIDLAIEVGLLKGGK